MPTPNTSYFFGHANANPSIRLTLSPTESATADSVNVDDGAAIAVMLVSPRPAAENHRRNGFGQDAHVVQQAAAADVLDVHPHPLGEGDAAATLHLPDAGQAG